MKKWISSLLAVCIFTAAMAGCGGNATNSDNNANAGASVNGGTFKIGYANSGDSDVFDKLKKDTFSELATPDSTIEVKYAEANMDQQKQLDQIDNFIMEEVDLIIIVPIDFSGVTPGVKAANAAGIPAICLGIESEGGDSIFVGCQNRDAGVMQAEFMAENLPENAKVLYLSGTPGLYHSVERHDGFYETMAQKRPDVQMLAEMTGEYTRDKAMKVMEDWCQTYDQFDAVVCANDQMALGAVEALKAANRLEGVQVAGIDATTDALNKIKSGEMAISIRQSAPALAQNCLDTAKKLQAGETVGNRVIVEFEPITAANVDEFLS